MADLQLRTALSQIEAVLRDQIEFAYKRRRPTLANLTALQALPSKNLADQDLVFVTAEGVAFRFDKLALTTPDANNIQPNDAPAGGRWQRTASTVSSGYLRTVQLYQGEANDAEILTRIAGQRPCVLIKWKRSGHRELALMKGGLYEYLPTFELWCISYNLRPQSQAAVGSEVTAEAANDPGANQILGDLKTLLGGSDLGQAGISFVKLGDEEMLTGDLGQRTFVYKLTVTVIATVQQPDTDLVTLTTPDALQIQYALANVQGQRPYDPKNYVVSGIQVPTGASLTQRVSAGSAYVGGVLVTFDFAGTPPITFPDASDTYRDLNPNGELTFTSVAAGSAPPSPTTGALRVGVTTTAGGAVTGDAYIAAALSSSNFGPPDQVPNH